jgi:AcrR family transcriptional regulator
MGTRERRRREFAEREQRFLDQARNLICENGLLNLQMARVARGCDYATGTLYQHFASKEDLLLALNSHLVASRVELFQRVVAWDAPSRERILAIAVADIIFARQYPEHFRLAQYVTTEAVWRTASPERREESLETGRPLGESVGRIVQDAIEAGDLVGHGLNPYELIVGNWTMAQGMHTLVHAEGLLDQYNIREPYRRLLMHQQLLLNGMGWHPVQDAWDDQRLNQLLTRIHRDLFSDLEDPLSCMAGAMPPSHDDSESL